MIPALILLMATYAWANRFAGGGFGWERLKHDAGGPLRGHGTLYGGLAALLVGAAVGHFLLGGLGLPLALLGLAWGLLRSLKFTKDGATPDTVGEVLLAFARHALVAAAGLAIGVWFARPLLGSALLIWAVLATALAAWYGHVDTKARRAGRPIGKQNSIVEVAQGAALGAAVWAGVITSFP